jgi:hypothetical protein
MLGRVETKEDYEPGAVMSDGTVFVGYSEGKPFAATLTDAPGTLKG